MQENPNRSDDQQSSVNVEANSQSAQLFHMSGRTIKLESGMVKFAWPGVYFEADFSGTSIGLDFAKDSKTGFNAEENTLSYFDVAIDGQHHSTLIQPQTLMWIHDLPTGEHSVKVTKRNEAPTVINNFKGFVAAKDGDVKAPSFNNNSSGRNKNFIFIGDSFTVGYGLESTTRECTPEQVVATTNSNKSFAALTSKNLHADYQQIAFSGRGLVRNFDGVVGDTMHQLVDKIFPWAQSPVAQEKIQADAVIIGLGINDFSTPIKAEENWTDETLAQAYVERYHELINWVRQYYGDSSQVVLSATWLGRETVFPGLVKKIAEQRKAQGDKNIVYWYYDGLDYGGCDWHPSEADHLKLAQELTQLLKDSL